MQPRQLAALTALLANPNTVQIDAVVAAIDTVIPLPGQPAVAGVMARTVHPVLAVFYDDTIAAAGANTLQDADLNFLRGAANYASFIQRPDVQAIPALVALFNTNAAPNNILRDALIAQWGAVGQNPPDANTISQLLADLADPTKNTNTADTILLLTNAFPPITALQLNAAGIVGANSENQLRGEARYQQFITRPDVQAMPELVRLLQNNAAIPNLLTAHWGQLANNIPDANAITTLRNKLADTTFNLPNVHNINGSPIDTTTLLVATFPPINGAHFNVGGGIQGAGTENKLRGEARYQEFMSRDDVKALNPTLETLLTSNGNVLRNALITGWGDLGARDRNPPTAAVITQLHADLIAARNAADVERALMTAFNPGAGAANDVANFTVFNIQAAGGGSVGGGIKKELRGLARYNAFMNRPDVKGLPALKELFEVDGGTPNGSIRKILSTLWGQRPPLAFPDETAIARLRGELASATNATEVEAALIKAFPTLTTADIQQNRQGIQNPRALGAPGVQNPNWEDRLRGEAAYQNFLIRGIGDIPELKTIIETNNLFYTTLRDHWGDVANLGSPPNGPSIKQLREDLLNANNDGDVRRALLRAFNRQPLAVDDPFLQLYGVGPGANVPQIRGGARYAQFLVDQKVFLETFPELERILRDPAVRAALIVVWGTNPPAPPIPGKANLEGLRDALAGVAVAVGAAGNAFTHANAFGNIPNLANYVTAALPNAGINANDADQLRGEAIYNKFLADHAAALDQMPVLRDLLRTEAVRQRLAPHWLANPVLANLDGLRTALALPATNSVPAIEQALTRVFGVSFTGLVSPLSENELRGQARFEEFLRLPEVTAMPGLVAILRSSAPGADIKGTLTTYLGTVGNTAPTAARVNNLRNELATRNNRVAMVDDVANFLNTEGVIPAMVHTALPTDAPANSLRGQARYAAFMDRPDVKQMPKLMDLLGEPVTANNRNVKAALLAHWGDPANTPPDATALAAFLDKLAVAPAANIANVVTLFNTAFNVDLTRAFTTDAKLQVNGSEDPFRGEAQYVRFMAAQKATLDNLPELKRILEAPDVRRDLEAHWATGGNKPPLNLDNLLNGIVGPAAVAGVGGANRVHAQFVHAFGVVNIGLALSAGPPNGGNIPNDGDEDKLRGEIKYVDFMNTHKEYLKTYPELERILKADDVRNALVADWGSAAAHAIPDVARLDALRDALASSANAAGARAAFTLNTTFNNIAGLDAAIMAPRPPAGTGAGISIDGLEEQLRGEAIYNKFLIDVTITPAFNDIPALKDILNLPDVRKTLSSVWGSGLKVPPHLKVPPENLDALKTALANANDLAGIQTAFTTFFGTNFAPVLTDAVLPKAKQKELLGQVRFKALSNLFPLAAPGAANPHHHLQVELSSPDNKAAVQAVLGAAGNYQKLVDAAKDATNQPELRKAMKDLGLPASEHKVRTILNENRDVVYKKLEAAPPSAHQTIDAVEHAVETSEKLNENKKDLKENYHNLLKNAAERAEFALNSADHPSRETLTRVSESASYVKANLTKYKAYLAQLEKDVAGGGLAGIPGAPQEYKNAVKNNLNNIPAIQKHKTEVEALITEAERIMGLVDPVLESPPPAPGAARPANIAYGSVKVTSLYHGNTLDEAKQKIEDHFGAPAGGAALRAAGAMAFAGMLTAPSAEKITAISTTTDTASLRVIDDATKTSRVEFYFKDADAMKKYAKESYSKSLSPLAMIPGPLVRKWAAENLKAFLPAKFDPDAKIPIRITRDPANPLPDSCIDMLRIYAKFKYNLDCIVPEDFKGDHKLSSKRVDAFKNEWAKTNPDDLGWKAEASLASLPKFKI